MAGPGRVCRPCDWWDTLFLLGVCVPRIVKRREKKAGGKKRREDAGSAGRKAPITRAMREDETSELFISIFIVAGHAKVTIYRYFFEASSWCQFDTRNRVTWRVYSSFCGLYDTGEKIWWQYTRDTTVDIPTEPIRSEIAAKSNLIGSSRAHMFYMPMT